MNYNNEIDDIKIISENGIEEAPEIIELNDDEKFKNDSDEIMEIETRGVRENNGIYFKVKDVANALGMNALIDTITANHTTYKEGYEYKYFICVINNEGKSKTKKEIYLTFLGLMRVFFISRNERTHKYINWIVSIVYTVQMGTVEQKKGLISSIKGISYEMVQEMNTINMTTVSCVYLIGLNTVENLREVMNIGEEYDDSMYVCKYGFSKDFDDRKNGHKTEFKQIQKYIELKIMMYSSIDPIYISQAEIDLKLELSEYKFDWNGKAEIIIIPKSAIPKIKKYYSLLSSHYAGYSQSLNTIILQKDIEIKKLIDDLKDSHNNNDRNNSIKFMEKDNEIKILTKDLEQNNLNHQKDIEILTKELEINNLNHQKDIEICSLRKDNEILRKDNEIFMLNNELNKLRKYIQSQGINLENL